MSEVPQGSILEPLILHVPTGSVYTVEENYPDKILLIVK